MPDPDYPDDTIPARRTLLLDRVADTGRNRFTYVYDFGGHWSHTIKITKPMLAVPGVAYPFLPDADGGARPRIVAVRTGTWKCRRHRATHLILDTPK